jgi:hypothetical protein
VIAFEYLPIYLSRMLLHNSTSTIGVGQTMGRCILPRILQDRLGREQILNIDALVIIRQFETILHYDLI